MGFSSGSSPSKIAEAPLWVTQQLGPAGMARRPGPQEANPREAVITACPGRGAFVAIPRLAQAATRDSKPKSGVIRTSRYAHGHLGGRSFVLLDLT